MEVTRQFFKLYFIVLCVLLVNSTLLMYFEKGYETQLNYPMYWDSWFYFMLVTITTVGFGDVSP